jgi:hypothetical protein
VAPLKPRERRGLRELLSRVVEGHPGRFGGR